MRHVLGLSKELIGFPRHLSQHVGGFVITKDRLDESVPVMNAAMPDRTHIEWDKDDLDAVGMMKVDVLALGMLSCIRRAFAFMEKHYGHRETLASLRHGEEDPRGARDPHLLPDVAHGHFAGAVMSLVVP